MATREWIYLLGNGSLSKRVVHSLSKLPSPPQFKFLFHQPSQLHAWNAERREICCIAENGPILGRGTKLNAEVLGDQQAPLPAVGAIRSINSVKNLIVSTPAHETTAALELVKDRLDASSHILFLQNGMGATDEAARELLFPDPKTRPTYWAGVSYNAIYSQSPFSFTQPGRFQLQLGLISSSQIQGTQEEQITQLRSYLMWQILSINFSDHRVHIGSPGKLRTEQLRKLVVDAVIEPLTVIFNCRNGDVVQPYGHPDRLKLVKALVREVTPVVKALLPSDRPVEAAFSEDGLLKLVVFQIRETARLTSTMVSDVRAGRQTEIDHINGYISAQAEKLGIACPMNDKIIEMVKSGTKIDDFAIAGHFLNAS